MRRIALAALLALAPTLAAAQFAVIAPTQPQSDNGDRIATTAWVNGLIANGLTLSSGKIWIGSAGNIATPQTPSGDCTIGLSGILTCTKTNGVAFATSATTDTTNAANISSGNLSVNRLNGGTGASATTFWNGASAWATAVTSVQCAGAAITITGSCPSASIAARFGGFDVWQRLVNAATTIAVPASTASQYVNDGWYLITGANQAATVTQTAGIATGSQFAAKVQRNNAQTGTGVIRYAVPLYADEVALLVGYNVALSFTMKEGANQSFSHTVNYIVYCGTGAQARRGASAYGGETSVITGAVTTTTSAARTTATSAAVIPANCTQMEIQFNETPSGTAGADDSFTVDDLNLEVVSGSTVAASPFPRWSYTEQLNAARVVARILAGGQAGTRLYPGLVESTSIVSVGGPLNPPMKTAPGVTFVGTAANIGLNDLAVQPAFAGTFGSNYSTPYTYGFQLNAAAATLTAGKAGFVSFSTAAEALFLSAEL